MKKDGGCSSPSCKSVILKHVLVFSMLFSTWSLPAVRDRTQTTIRKQTHTQKHHGVTHILVTHVPVRPLSIWHHLPGNDPITPDIRSRRELPVGDCLWCCPTHWDFTTLTEEKRKITKAETKSDMNRENICNSCKRHQVASLGHQLQYICVCVYMCIFVRMSPHQWACVGGVWGVLLQIPW